MSTEIGKPGESAVADVERVTQRPKLFKVLLHNDHYTTMEFVVDVLMMVFGKGEAEAIEIMLRVHQEGVGIAGRYVHAIAESKASKVHSLAEEAGYPLRCSLEPD